MSREEDYKEIIKENLSNTIDYGYIPELGMHRSGKVRDIHFTSFEVGKPIIMVASDRVSSFDFILNRRIPFKGLVLNLLNKWALENTKDIIENASLESPHPNILVQNYCDNIMIECVVRGYVWGSLAADYEKGKAEICGVKVPEGMLRYQKLEEPIFTPTTKSDDHDAPMTFEEVQVKLGKRLARQVKDVSIKLYNRASELALKQGLIFIDTKYEFGLNEKGKLVLIDEANTPDSSRYCDAEEYGKFAEIEKEMKKGKHANVSVLLEKKPDLKIKELSKQFVRDVLVSKGFGYGSIGEPPNLEDEDVIEVSYRYIRLYERLTGNKFVFPSESVKQNLINSLREKGWIKGNLAVVWSGSDSDLPHMNKIKEELSKYNIPVELRICSAHKQAAEGEVVVEKYNDSIEPIVFVTVAGGTDALSGVVSFHSVHPVISCPPDPSNYFACIGNPPGSSNSLILKPSNVAKHVAQIFGHGNVSLQDLIISNNKKKVKKLQIADKQSRGL